MNNSFIDCEDFMLSKGHKITFSGKKRENKKASNSIHPTEHCHKINTWLYPSRLRLSWTGVNEKKIIQLSLQATSHPSPQWFVIQIQTHKPAQFVVTNQVPNYTLNIEEHYQHRQQYYTKYYWKDQSMVGKEQDQE